MVSEEKLQKKTHWSLLQTILEGKENKKVTKQKLNEKEHLYITDHTTSNLKINTESGIRTHRNYGTLPWAETHKG